MMQPLHIKDIFPFSNDFFLVADSTQFPKRLKQARLDAGLTQKELGRSIGHDQQKIERLENGKEKRPSVDLIMALSEQLGCSPAWLAFDIADLDELRKESVTLAKEANDLNNDQIALLLALVRQMKGETGRSTPDSENNDTDTQS